MDKELETLRQQMASQGLAFNQRLQNLERRVAELEVETLQVQPDSDEEAYLVVFKPV